MNNQVQKPGFLIRAFAAILTPVCILTTGFQVSAEEPSAAHILYIEGSGLVLRDGVGLQAAKVGDQIRGNHSLSVPGQRRGWAYLGFVFESSVVSDNAGLLVQAGPDDLPSEWSFPCTAKGGLRIAWKRGNNRGCEEGIRLQPSESQTTLSLNPINYLLQAFNNNLNTQTSDELIVLPTSSEPVVFQVYESATGIEVETVEGDLLISSAKYSQGKLIPEGQRYSYDQDTIVPIDRDAIARSPEMQDFLNPNNWLSKELPQEVATGIAEQLGEYRAVLGMPPQTVATDSSIFSSLK